MFKKPKQEPHYRKIARQMYHKTEKWKALHKEKGLSNSNTIELQEAAKELLQI